MNLKITFFISIIFMILPRQSLAEVYLLESLTKEEFLSFPSGVQSIYVAGALDGMAFVSYGNNEPTLDAWQKCVRRETLGKTTEEVVSFLKTNDDFNETLPSALAQIIGQRGCPRQ